VRLDGKVVVFTAVPIGTMFMELNFKEQYFKGQLKTNEMLKDVIYLYGDVNLLGRERRFESDLKARILGADIASSEILLDFKERRIRIVAFVDLMLFRNDVEFITEKDWYDPRFRVASRAGIGSFDVVGLELKGSSAYVRVKATAVGVSVKISFPSIDTINGDVIERALLAMIDPRNAPEALKQMLKGNFNVTVGGLPGDNNGGEPSFDKSGKDGKGGEPGPDVPPGSGQGKKNELRVPKGASPILVDGDKGPIEYMIYMVGGKRYLNVRNPQTGQFAKLPLFRETKQDEFDQILAAVVEKRGRIKSFGLIGDSGETEVPTVTSVTMDVYDFTPAGSTEAVSKENPASIRWSLGGVN
jgi:hypothetical protein